MKQLLLLTTVLLTSLVGFGQITINKVGQATNLDNQTFTITWDGVTEDVHEDFHITNLATASQDLRIERLWVNTINGYSDYVCWGRADGVGECYSASANASWTTPSGVSLATDDKALLTIHVSPSMSNGGSASYRYNVVDADDEVIGTFTVQFVSTAAVKEVKAAAAIISVYPNPAVSALTIAAPGLDNYTVRISDVLGKVVYDEDASTSTKKIDVSDFKNGVYLVTVIDKGTALQTRRVVVKH